MPYPRCALVVVIANRLAKCCFADVAEFTRVVVGDDAADDVDIGKEEAGTTAVKLPAPSIIQFVSPRAVDEWCRSRASRAGWGRG
jgi:hypothetical protein